MNRRPLRLFRSFQGFNYRIWVAGALISNIGTWVQRTAQDWLVLTQLTHHSASAVGMVMALQFGPQMLLLPWTGYIADHFNQRRVLLATQAAMAALALTLGLLTLCGLVQLWHVCVLAFLSGSAAAFDAPVRQTFVAELVGEANLPNALSLNSTSFNAARMIGPAIAGLVIGAIGIGWSFVINGLSFLGVLMSLTLLRLSELHPQPRAKAGKGGFGAGLRYVWSQPHLRTILMMLFLIGTFGLNFPIFIAVMTVGVFHADALHYGLLSSFLALGTVTGALMAAGREAPRFAHLAFAAGLFGLGCALAALAPFYWLFACALTATGIAALTFTNTSNVLLQISTPPAMRGRVMALRVAVGLGGTPIGAPIVGWTADTLGPRWALGLGAAAGLSAAAVAAHALVRTGKRQARQSEPGK